MQKKVVAKMTMTMVDALSALAAGGVVAEEIEDVVGAAAEVEVEEEVVTMLIEDHLHAIIVKRRVIWVMNAQILKRKDQWDATTVKEMDTWVDNVQSHNNLVVAVEEAAEEAVEDIAIVVVVEVVVKLATTVEKQDIYQENVPKNKKWSVTTVVKTAIFRENVLNPRKWCAITAEVKVIFQEIVLNLKNKIEVAAEIAVEVMVVREVEVELVLNVEKKVTCQETVKNHNWLNLT
jgi:hypothetical protein